MGTALRRYIVIMAKTKEDLQRRISEWQNIAERGGLIIIIIRQT